MVRYYHRVLAAKNQCKACCIPCMMSQFVDQEKDDASQLLPHAVNCRRFCLWRHQSVFCLCMKYLGIFLGSRYGDGAGNTVEENSSIFSLIRMRELPSMLWHCWLGGRKGIRPVKKIWGDDGGGHWLVRMEWRPVCWSVCLPLLISPCTIKSRSSLLAAAHPCGPEKGP